MGALEDVKAAVARQTEAARERYEDHTLEREANSEARAISGAAVHDTPEQLEARARRLVRKGETPMEAVLDLAAASVPDRRAALERIIGASNDLQSTSFLIRGTRAASTVARITLVDNGREQPLGTGFLVSPRLLMTNNHVLPDATFASQVVVEFSAEVDVDNRPVATARYVLDPAAYFLTDEHLDFSLVAVAVRPGEAVPGDRFGWNRLIREQGKIVTGEPVNVVGHPMGRLKEISIRNSDLQLQLNDFLHYAADTEPGNSGSPVYNDQWEIVALHHSGVPRTDQRGRYLRKDGKLWKRGDGDDAIDWISNEGARVSVILRAIEAAPMTPAGAELLAGMGLGAGLGNAAPGPAPTPGPAPVPVGGVIGGVVTPPGETPPAVTPVPPLAGAGLAPSGVTVPAGVLGDGVPGAAGTGATGTGAAGTAVADQPAPRTVAAGEAVGKPGVKGTSANGVSLVFLHGRSQQGRDPLALRRSWTGGLNRGLTLAGLAPIDVATAWLPFYADRFVAAMQARESLAVPEAFEAAALADAGDEVAEALAPALPSTRGVYEELIAEAARAAGMPEVGPAEEGLLDAAVGKLQGQLDWLAGRSGLDDLVIALFFRDVAAYLDRTPVRQAVLDAVQETLPTSGRIVLVSHSLGTVVGMDLLTTLDPSLDVTLLVTAGSPLGLDSVFRRLLVRGPNRPARIRRWVNAFCAPDPVAIGCPLADDWAGQIEEVVTKNPRERAHNMEEYLADARVARRISQALLAPVAPVS
jgi:endonuclease G